MKLVAAVAALAACSSPAPRPVLVRTAAVTADGGVAPEPPPATGRLVTAPHSAPIARLALAAGGGAVLSQDAAGDTRLWPALDGSREPVLVHLPAARQLALAKRGDGWLAVARDESGGLYIATLDRDGRARSHATVGIEPPIAGIAMTRRGIVAWRTDHHVVLLDASGKTLADLAAEPQQRIAALAVGPDTALAILELASGDRRVRRLSFSPRLEWGAWIDQVEAPFAGAVLALAPDGQHYAVGDIAPTKAQVVIYDGKGARISKGQLQASAMTISFYDNDRLLVASPESGFGWLTTEEHASVLNVTPSYEPTDRLAVTAGAGVVVSARDSDLLLMTRESTQYLGYGVTGSSATERGPQGALVLTGLHPLQLGATLEESAPIDLAVPESGSVVDLAWVGDDDYLVETALPTGTFQVALVDGKKGAATLLRKDLAEAHVLAYEPSTQLVTLSFGRRTEVARLDRKARRLATLASPVPKTTHEEVALTPVSPALARGSSLVHVVLRDKSIVRWLPDAATAGTANPGAATATLAGAFLGADAAGHVYAWEPGADRTLHVAIYTDGKVTGTLPTQGPARLWPDGAGTRVLQTSPDEVTLYKDGARAWTLPLSGTLEARWLTDGALAVAHATGVVRVDAATGQVTAARCGWQFGLAPRPHDPAPRIESICAQLSP